MDTLGTRHRIARWLRPLFELEEGARADRVVLQHVSVNDKYADVATVPFGPESTEEYLAQLAEAIESALTADAEGLGGLQRYVVIAMRGSDQLTRLPMRMSGTELTADGEPLDSEPATMKGVLAQLMRHLEAQARMFTLGYGQVLSVMQRTIARQQATVEAAEDVRLESVALAERMLSDQHERDLAQQNTQHEVDRREKMFQQASDLLTLGASHFLASKAPLPAGQPAPVGPSAVDLLIKQLLQSLSGEQIEELRKVLTLEQFLLISRLAQQTATGQGSPSDEPPSTSADDAGRSPPPPTPPAASREEAGAPAGGPAPTAPATAPAPAPDPKPTRKRRHT